MLWTTPAGHVPSPGALTGWLPVQADAQGSQEVLEAAGSGDCRGHHQG